MPEKLPKGRSLERLGRELNAFAGANSDAPGMQGTESSLLTHPVIGSGIAIAHIPAEWGNLTWRGYCLLYCHRRSHAGNHF